MLSANDVKALLDDKARQYESPNFIVEDPISVPHLFSRRSDIEIAGLLAATIAWGNRKAIVRSARQMISLLGECPTDFVLNASETDIARLDTFVYRTFQQDDLPGIVCALRSIYSREAEDALESIFAPRFGETIKDGIARFRDAMLPSLSQRTFKHIADVRKGAAAKRLNMFLRWMVRSSARGVDFGLWKSIAPSDLVMPLDVHTASVGRCLGLILRKQNDWKAATELTNSLREFDPHDPVRYDFALFSLGINEHFA